MLHATALCHNALCNVARGAGRVLAAMAPAWMADDLGAFKPPDGTFPTAHQSSASDSKIRNEAHCNSRTNGRAEEMNVLPEELRADLARTSATYKHGKTDIRYRAVPSTQVTRAAGFGTLFAHLAWERVTGSTPDGALISSSGHQRIVDTLCRMRGAVLKLGQMLSIQDSNTVPPHVTALFERVRDQAFAMPTAQLERTLTKEFGGDGAWRTNIFESFNQTPIAAASIGQVHYGKLKAGSVVQNPAQDTHFSTRPPTDVARNDTPLEVAVKVQYPGVAKSIVSDVSNLKMLMSLNILPPGMFVDSILKELRNELSMECQYTIEGAKQERYRGLVEADPSLRDTFRVPRVYRSLSTDQVLVTEFVHGVPVDQLAKRADIPQAFRNYLSDKMMRLTLSELFRWRFMQTDPNYANFLYDAGTGKLNLLDFGAAREYDAAFVTDYLDVVAAAAKGDREAIIEKSIRLGFLTGREMREMIDAHVESVLLLGQPFRDREAPFDFSTARLPERIQQHVPTIVRLRLRPPPTPVYSLHRRLSGTILLATRFGATITSGPTFWAIYDDVKTNL